MKTYSGKTKSGLKVTAMSNGRDGELYCSVKTAAGALVGDLCGWYRTGCFKLALSQVERAENNRAAIEAKRRAAL